MAPRHIALAVLVTAVWGFNFVVIHVGLETFPPLLLTVLRFVVAALPVLVVRPPKVPFRRMLAIGLTWFLGQFVFIFIAMTKGMPPGLASLTLQAQAFFTILIAALVLRERPSARQLTGVMVAFCGLALIGFSVGGDMTLLGLGLTMCAALSWGVGNVLMRGTGKVDMLPMVVWLSLVPPLPAFALSLSSRAGRHHLRLRPCGPSGLWHGALSRHSDDADRLRHLGPPAQPLPRGHGGALLPARAALRHAVSRARAGRALSPAALRRHGPHRLRPAYPGLAAGPLAAAVPKA